MDAAIGQAAIGLIVARALAGDEVAFAQIVAAHHHDMTRVGYLITGDADLADEAVQAAWAIAWRKLRSLREPERLRPWLMTVAANEARQLTRARRRRSVREIAVEPMVELSDSRAGDPSVRSAEVDLRNALLRLAPEDRMLIAMRYAVGLSSTEIGLIVGMTGGGVRARLARLVVRLREDLGDV